MNYYKIWLHKIRCIVSSASVLKTVQTLLNSDIFHKLTKSLCMMEGGHQLACFLEETSC